MERAALRARENVAISSSSSTAPPCNNSDQCSIGSAAAAAVHQQQQQPLFRQCCTGSWPGATCIIRIQANYHYGARAKSHTRESNLTVNEPVKNYAYTKIANMKKEHHRKSSATTAAGSPFQNSLANSSASENAGVFCDRKNVSYTGKTSVFTIITKSNIELVRADFSDIFSTVRLTSVGGEGGVQMETILL